MSAGQIILPGSARVLTWSVAHQAKHAGQASGDGYLICQSNNAVMFAVADGSGSGPDAAAATTICLKALGQQEDFNLPNEFSRCHVALKDSRGAALGLAVVNTESDTLSWASVGDIDGLLVRAASPGDQKSIVRRGGVLGSVLPTVTEQEHVLKANDIVVLTSDGVQSSFPNDARTGVSVTRTARSILNNHARPNDDSIVMVFSMETVQ